MRVLFVVAEAVVHAQVIVADFSAPVHEIFCRDRYEKYKLGSMPDPRSRARDKVNPFFNYQT